MSSINDLRDLLSVLRDGVTFYGEAGERAEQAEHRQLFARMAEEKRAALRAIEKLLLPSDRPPDGTWGGKIRECYARVLTLLAGDKDAVYIRELEAAEDRVIEEFRRCLSTIEEPQARALLERHYPNALAAHEQMRALKRQVDAQ